MEQGLQGTNKEFEGKPKERHQKGKRGKKSMTDFGYWPRWPTITLNEEAPDQISRNLEHILNFFGEKTGIFSLR